MRGEWMEYKELIGKRTQSTKTILAMMKKFHHRCGFGAASSRRHVVGKGEMMNRRRLDVDEKGPNNDDGPRATEHETQTFSTIENHKKIKCPSVGETGRGDSDIEDWMGGSASRPSRREEGLQ